MCLSRLNERGAIQSSHDRPIIRSRPQPRSVEIRRIPWRVGGTRVQALPGRPGPSVGWPPPRRSRRGLRGRVCARATHRGALVDEVGSYGQQLGRSHAVRELRLAEVLRQDVTIENCSVTASAFGCAFRSNTRPATDDLPGLGPNSSRSEPASSNVLTPTIVRRPDRGSCIGTPRMR